MSIAVPLDELGRQLRGYPWAFLVTVSADGRSHSLAVPTHLDDDGTLRMPVGRTATANATERHEVTMLFPPASGAEYSLILDGTAAIGDGVLVVTPLRATLHRPALGDATGS